MSPGEAKMNYRVTFGDDSRYSCVHPVHPFDKGYSDHKNQAL